MVKFVDRHRDHRFEITLLDHGPSEFPECRGVDEVSSADGFPYYFAEGHAILETEGVGCWKRIAQHRVALAGSFVRPSKEVAQQIDALKLVHSDDRLDV